MSLLDSRLRSPGGCWLAALGLAFMISPAIVAAQEISIGGTGGALGTMKALADAYRKSHPETEIAVLPSLGSTGGVKAVLAGAIQVAVSSRPLKPGEVSRRAVGSELGRTPFVFAVPAKTKVDSITIGDLVDIYAGKLQNWPDGTRIRVVLRPVGDSDSDMVRSISPEVKQAKMEAEKRPGMLFAVTDQDSADSIETIPGAFGSSTLAQIRTEKRAMKVLRFNGVDPTPETLTDGSYPYFKPLFIVTGPKTSAAAQEFVAFVRSATGREILARSGYVPPWD